MHENKMRKKAKKVLNLMGIEKKSSTFRLPKILQGSPLENILCEVPLLAKAVLELTKEYEDNGAEEEKEVNTDDLRHCAKALREPGEGGGWYDQAAALEDAADEIDRLRNK